MPASERPSNILVGFNRKSRSINIKISNRNTAHQPAAPASPAEFCRSWIIQGNDITSHTPLLYTTFAPNAIDSQLQPTDSFGVKRRIKIRNTGPNICERYK